MTGEVPTLSHYIFWYIFLIIGTMKEIKLSQNKIALVDDEDFEYLSQFSWQVAKSGHILRAKRTAWVNGAKVSIYMHREILNAPKGQEIDHHDTNGLNNQRYNLRFTSRSGNRANTVKNKGCYSEYKGVTWNKRAKKWIAQLTFNYCHINMGYFQTEQAAALSYDAKAKELFGVFANLNFK